MGSEYVARRAAARALNVVAHTATTAPGNRKNRNMWGAVVAAFATTFVPSRTAHCPQRHSFAPYVLAS